jgi:uncharacterized protein YndB with AHSA1/START domain
MQPSQEKQNQSANHLKSSRASLLLVIERQFHAPLEELYNAFKTAEAIKVWWWPNNLHVADIDYDFQVGGNYFISMKGSNQNGGMKGQFEEISPSRRIVMSDEFADKEGRAISAAEAGMPGNWPAKCYITFDFSSANDEVSILKLSQEGIPNEMQKDCIRGWNEMFDKLARYIDARGNTLLS